jgi:hypothetical protein
MLCFLTFFKLCSIVLSSIPLKQDIQILPKSIQNLKVLRPSTIMVPPVVLHKFLLFHNSYMYVCMYVTCRRRTGVESSPSQPGNCWKGLVFSKQPGFCSLCKSKICTRYATPSWSLLIFLLSSVGVCIYTFFYNCIIISVSFVS